MLLLVLNEMSCAADCDRGSADEAMAEFVAMLRLITSWRPKETSLVTEVSLRELLVAEGYSVHEWGSRHRDQWRWLLQRRNVAPFSRALPDQPESADVEYTHAGTPARGLGVAHLLDTLAVSLPIGSSWDMTAVQLERCRLEEDGSGTEILIEDQVEVRHAARREQADDHQRWIRDSTLSQAVTGQQFWERRGDLFPNLRFLSRVEKDLQELDLVPLHQARRRLDELQFAVAAWVPGTPSPQWPSKVTDESNSRSSLTEWADDAGVVRNFGLHARFTGNFEGRIHFRLLHEEATICIAYIGFKRLTNNVPRRARR